MYEAFLEEEIRIMSKMASLVFPRLKKYSFRAFAFVIQGGKMRFFLRMISKLFGPLGAGGGALILAIASTVSYLLGWVRDAIFARTFGITDTTDSYFKAFLLPDTLLTIFITGALLGLVIPLYMKARKITEEEGEKTFGTFFFVLNAFYASAAILVIIFLDPILRMAFPETSDIQMPILREVTNILIFSNLFFALSNFLGHFLLAHKRFFAYSVAPLFYNLGIIIGIVFFHRELGIYSAAWGALVGAAGHFILRLIDFLISRERFRFSFDFRNPFFRELISSMWPKVVALLVLQAGFYFFARLGDGVLGEGRYSAFQYARNLQSFAVSLFGISLATAVFPFLAEFVAEKKMEHFIFRLEKSLRQILFLAIPSAAGMILIANEIVRVIYGDQSNNLLTVAALIPLALSIPLESVNHLLVRAYHVLQDTLHPMFASLLFLAVLIGCSLLFVFQFGLGVEAFSIAYFLGFLVQEAYLFFMLSSFSVAFPWKTFLPNFFRMLWAVFFMSIAVFVILFLLRDSGYIVRFVSAVSAGGIIYLSSAYLMRMPEVTELAIMKWFRKSSIQENHGEI